MRTELTQRGVEHSRENMRALGEAWERKYGSGYLSRRAIQMYNQSEKILGYNGLALGSVRRPSEARTIQDEGGSIIWIDAEQRLRYGWIQAARRGRNEDNVSYDQWIKDENIELLQSGDSKESAISLAEVKEIANIRINNNFTSVLEFQKYLTRTFNL